MVDNLKIVSNNLLVDYEIEVTFNPLDMLTPKSKEELPFDYFQFYTSISSVYSSKMEGEEIEMDSFFKAQISQSSIPTKLYQTVR